MGYVNGQSGLESVHETSGSEASVGFDTVAVPVGPASERDGFFHPSDTENLNAKIMGKDWKTHLVTLLSVGNPWGNKSD